MKNFKTRFAGFFIRLPQVKSKVKITTSFIKLFVWIPPLSGQSPSRGFCSNKRFWMFLGRDILYKRGKMRCNWIFLTKCVSYTFDASFRIANKKKKVLLWRKRWSLIFQNAPSNGIQLGYDLPCSVFQRRLRPSSRDETSKNTFGNFLALLFPLWVDDHFKKLLKNFKAKAKAKQGAKNRRWGLNEIRLQFLKTSLLSLFLICH